MNHFSLSAGKTSNKIEDIDSATSFLMYYFISVNKLSDMEPYRKFALAIFRRFGIGTSGFEEPITKESAILIEELAKVADKPLDLTWYFNNATSNIISHVVFGKRFEFSDERIHHLTDLLNRQNELAGSGGLEIFVPINIPSKAKREMIKVADQLLQFIDTIIEEHRRNFQTHQQVEWRQ